MSQVTNDKPLNSNKISDQTKNHVLLAALVVSIAFLVLGIVGSVTCFGLPCHSAFCNPTILSLSKNIGIICSITAGSALLSLICVIVVRTFQLKAKNASERKELSAEQHVPVQVPRDSVEANEDASNVAGPAISATEIRRDSRPSSPIAGPAVVSDVAEDSAIASRVIEAISSSSPVTGPTDSITAPVVQRAPSPIAGPAVVGDVAVDQTASHSLSAIAGPTDSVAPVAILSDSSNSVSEIAEPTQALKQLERKKQELEARKLVLKQQEDEVNERLKPKPETKLSASQQKKAREELTRIKNERSSIAEQEASIEQRIRELTQS